MFELSHAIVALASAGITAGILTFIVSPTPSQVELANKNIAVTILADAAMGELDDEGRAQVERKAKERMKESFGEDAEIEFTDEFKDGE